MWMFTSHDLHVHSNYSDGTSTPLEMVRAASEKELEAVAISDHGPEISVGIKRKEIRQMIRDVEFAKEDSEITVLCGIEANTVNLEGEIDVREEFLEEMDIVLGGVHSINASWKSSSERISREYFETVLNLMKRREIDILTHPFWYYEDLSTYLSQEDLESFCEVAAREDVAIELNEKYQVPKKKLLSICRRKGTVFSLGSDAHGPKEVGELNWGCKMLEKIGAGEEELIVSELLSD